MREDLQHGAATAADTGGMEGLLPLGWVQPQPTAVSMKLAWGRTPREVTSIKLYPLPLSKPCIKPNKNLQNYKNP